MLYLSELSSTHFGLAMMLPILLAQQAATEPEASPASIIGGLIGYVICSFLVWKIVQKCNVENAWFAWIPILGTYIIFKAGDEQQPVLWTILSCIPCVNIIAIYKLIIAWINILKKLGQSPWLLLLFIVPCVNILFLAYLAFG